MDSPPPLHLVGPAANNPHYEKVFELRRRLGVAFSHPSITAEQREKILLAESWLGHAPDEARLSIPMILLEVEAMPRPANGGSRSAHCVKSGPRSVMRSVVGSGLRSVARSGHYGNESG